MIADDYYEPDSEDLAWELAKEREVEQWVSCVRESEGQFRASTGTDKQLRNISKESKSIARDLLVEHRFDVVGDCFEVDLDGETSITVSRNGVRILRALPRGKRSGLRKNVFAGK